MKKMYTVLFLVATIGLIVLYWSGYHEASQGQV